MTREVRFQMRKDRIRKRLLKYTRKAYRMLPRLEKPRILDVGCGSGVPTMELARLSNGEIIGVDVKQELLDILVDKIEKAGIWHRVKPVKCSLFEMRFPDESFDIIWAEGSISVIGFKEGLEEWKRFLKPDGFVAVHDERGDIKEKLKQVLSCGCEPLGYFVVDEDIWQAEYFAPLEKLVCETRAKHADGTEGLMPLGNAQREIDQFKRNPGRSSSVFIVARKRSQ